MNLQEIESEQRNVCRTHGARFVAASLDLKVGVALDTMDKSPTNGLRHPAQGDTTGWYLWGGDEFSADPDFFQPLHTRHLVERYPRIATVLGLPPGYRFLMAENHLDIWFDPKLLEV